MHHPAAIGGPFDTRNPNTGQPKQQRRTVIQARGLSRRLPSQQSDFKRSRAHLLRHAERGQEPDLARSRSKSHYDAWPFAEHLTRALDTAQVRAFCVGIGVDPLTFATDILAVVTIDAPLYDELFDKVTASNVEGSILHAVPFTAEIVEQYASKEPTQAAGAGLLRLAWRHRRLVLD